MCLNAVAFGCIFGLAHCLREALCGLVGRPCLGLEACASAHLTPFRNKVLRRPNIIAKRSVEKARIGWWVLLDMVLN